MAAFRVFILGDRLGHRLVWVIIKKKQTLGYRGFAPQSDTMPKPRVVFLPAFPVSKTG